MEEWRKKKLIEAHRALMPVIDAYRRQEQRVRRRERVLLLILFLLELLLFALMLYLVAA